MLYPAELRGNINNINPCSLGPSNQTQRSHVTVRWYAYQPSNSVNPIESARVGWKTYPIC